MLKLCRTKMTLPLHPPPIGLYLLINIPSLSFLKELLDNNYSVKSESMGAPGRRATCHLSDFPETWPV